MPTDPAGVTGPTRSQAQSKKWRRTTPGRYVPAYVDSRAVEQRILEQAQRLGPSGAVTGWAALRLHGGGFFDGLDRNGRTILPVPLASGTDRIRPHPAITVSRDGVAPHEITYRYGIACVSPERALFDEVRRLGEVREGSVAIDMAAAARLTSPRRLRAYCLGRCGARGVRLVLAALDLSVEDSESPPESRFRHIWELDAGWPRPLCNREVFDLTGKFLGRPDLLDPDLGIVGEYDGAHHRTRQRHARDVNREHALRAVGLEYVPVVGQDLANPARVVDRMEAARARARLVRPLWRLGSPGLTLDEILDRRTRAAE